MSRLAALVLTFLLLGSGAYVLAATGGRPGGGDAAVAQYELKTPEPPVYETTAGKPKSEKKAQEPDEAAIGGEEKGGRDNGPDAARGAPEESAGAPVETAATGPAGGATGLPFTGLDLLALAVVGLSLLALGLAPQGLRRSR
jgi:hypothetical protein